MRFAHPYWLVVALLTCIALIALWRASDLRQRAALERFVSAHLRSELTRSISVAKRRAQRGLFMAGCALLCAALAGPQLGFRWEEVNRRGNEIVFAIDTSRSMATPDVKPNRLTRAKLAVADFANQLDGDAVGIVAFAGSAFLVCPITLDYGAFRESLSAIDTSTIPRGGTNISSAILEAQRALRRRPGSDKVLILVTDGEDLEGSAAVAAQSAKDTDGLRIYAVGVGTASGDLIPIPQDQGGGFVKDETGAFVKSRLDEAALQAIAGATGGFYVPLGARGEGLDRIFKTVLGSLAKHDLASRRQKIYIERYQWPLAGSLAALLASLVIGTRRRSAARAHAPASFRSAAASFPSAGGSPAARAAVIPPAARIAMASSLALLALFAPRAPLAATTASTTPPAAAPTAPSGEPAQAYNRGTIAYRAGRFPQAAQAFQESITKAPSSDAKRLADQEDAYYNLGNTLYRAGQNTEKSAPKETIDKWNEAVKAYETALQLRPDDVDSKYNRDFVKRKIEALKDAPPPQGSGPSQGHPPPQGQPPSQEQPPSQAQPPSQGQPPSQAQPPSQGQRSGQPPPGQAQNQSPPSQPQTPGSPPPPTQPQAQPQPAPAGGAAAKAADAADGRTADNERAPGQMSREEARELLDSVKGDERRPPGASFGQRDPDDRPPDRPIKNW